MIDVIRRLRLTAPLRHSSLRPARIDSYRSRARDLTLRGESEPAKLRFRGALSRSCLIRAPSLCVRHPMARTLVNSRSATMPPCRLAFWWVLRDLRCTLFLPRPMIQRISAKSNISTEGYRATHLFLVQSGRARFYHLTKAGRLSSAGVVGAGRRHRVGDHAEKSASLYGNRRSNFRL